VSGGATTRLLPFLINAALAAFWAVYAWSRFELWQDTLDPLLLVLVARNGAMTLLFLCRRPASTVSRDSKEWAAAIVGTTLGFFYGEGQAVLPRSGAVLMTLAAVLSVVSTLALGRSFGIVPANRGVKTAGPYAIVRHPLYFCYAAFDVGFLLQAASVRNALVFAGMVVTTYLRGRFEEGLLRLDARYRAYAARTRYMFIPGVL
jgi:protein-S-isoprenylcysteine O-methyltransferase Ste14